MSISLHPNGPKQSHASHSTEMDTGQTSPLTPRAELCVSRDHMLTAPAVLTVLRTEKRLRSSLTSPMLQGKDQDRPGFKSWLCTC